MKTRTIIIVIIVLIILIIPISIKVNNEKTNIKADEVNNLINDYLENNNIDYYTYNYVLDNKVIVGLNDINKKDVFINEVFTKCCGSKYISYLKENKIIEFRESKEVFDGKILEIRNDSYLVEVISTNSSFKIGDSVVVFNHFNNFNVGDIITITYNGMIEETYPPRIAAVDIIKK